MNRYLKNKNAITGRVNEELVMMDIDRGKYFSLNNVATRIWEILDVPLGMEEICLQLMQEYAVEEVQCRAETEACLAEMISLGLLVETNV
jgi:hypothetical protein